MRNYVQEGIVLTVKPTAAVVSGQLVKVGSIIGIAACDGEANAEVEVRVEGVFALPKGTPADAFTAGTPAGASFPAGTIVATGGTAIGWITEASASGVATVNVRLVPGI
jgi:predicted RecA/RadA family phage recombinase